MSGGLNNIQEQVEHEEDTQGPIQGYGKDPRQKGNKDLDQFNHSISLSTYSAAQARVDANKRRKNKIKEIMEDR